MQCMARFGVSALVVLEAGLVLAAQPGWVVQRPVPQPRDLWAVKTLDEATAIAVGGGGVVVRVSEAGGSWTVTRPFGTAVELNGLSFVSTAVGTVVGSNGLIARTIDGGLQWRTQDSGTTDALFAVSFADRDIGTAVGAHGAILGTTDGGATWVRQESGLATTLTGVCRVDAQRAVAVGYDGLPQRVGRVLRTTDGGQSWSLQPLYSSAVSDVAFIDADDGFIVGTDDYWGYGRIWRTEDGGESWQAVGPIGYPSLGKVTFLGARSAVALGSTGGWRTDDLGETWRSVGVGATVVSFAGGNIGTAVGRSGHISRTEDGGERWVLLSSPVPMLRSVFMVSPDIAAVVGEQVILRTDDGGGAWKPQASSIYGDVYNAVQFIDARTGFAAGLSLLRTTDAGVSWTSLDPGDRPSVAVHFLDAQRGWLATRTRILRTDDGGESW